MKLVLRFLTHYFVDLTFIYLALFVCLVSSANAQSNGAKGFTIPKQGESFFALSVDDIEKMEKWYTDVFQLTTLNKIDVPDGSANIRLLYRPGLMIELLRHSQAKERDDKNASFKLHGVFKAGLFISNIEEAYLAIKNRNIETITDVIKDDTTGYLFFIFEDPEGNLIHLWQKN